MDWNGNQVWSYEIADPAFHQHHDIEDLPDGNILAIAREMTPESEALDAGVDSSHASSHGGVWAEAILEIDPGSSSSNIILFNNGHQKLLPFSNILELEISFPYSYGKAEIIWEYGSSGEDESFFSDRISGVQRLENGNTLICSGIGGWLFEVDPDGEKVWGV